MPSSKEFRKRAWNNLKGKYLRALGASVIVSFIVSIGTSLGSFAGDINSILEMVAQSGTELDEIMKAGAAVISGVGLVAFVVDFAYSLLISDPLSVGSCKFFLLNTTEEPPYNTLLFAFRNNYKNNVTTLFLMFLKIMLWSFLFIVPGIIKYYEYAMVPYILGENPDITSNEAFAMSRKMMQGNKMKLFLLELSFIGWMILGTLTCGIGFVFLKPYQLTANAEFYKEVRSRV